MRIGHVSSGDSYDSNHYTTFKYICGNCNMFHCSYSDILLELESISDKVKRYRNFGYKLSELCDLQIYKG